MVDFGNFFSAQWTNIYEHNFKRNKLAAVLMCLKLGNSYEAISALFGIHRTTLSDWFDEVIYSTAMLSEGAVVWWDKDKIQARMPEECR